MKSKQELRQMGVSEDDSLEAVEKETVLNIPKDKDGLRIATDVATVTKWVLSIRESEVEHYRTVGGAVVGVTAIVPKGVVKLQGNARKSNAHSQMVAYGPLKDKEQ